MPVVSNTDEVSQILRAAYLYTEFNMSNQEIADYLKTSQPTISRRLKEARLRKWLIEKPSLNWPEEMMDRREAICDNVDLEKKILSLSKGNISIVRVCPRGKDDKNMHEYIAAAAAKLIEEHLASGKHKIGVNWGFTLFEMAQRLKPIRNPDISVIPIFGDLGLPSSDNARRYDSSNIARLVAQRFHLKNDPIRLTFQAIIPESCIGEIETIKQYLNEGDTSYREVFGGKGEAGLIGEIDTLITSIGALTEDTLWRHYLPEFKNYSLLNKLRTKKVVGDVGQHFLIQDVGKDGEVDEINRRINGLKLEHFSMLAEHHRKIRNVTNPKNIGLGVVVLASGNIDKTEIVLEAIKRKLLNVLILDEDQAKKVIETMH